MGAPIGRKRGFSWERQFAKKLSLWWSDGEDQYIFRRSHGSGSAYQDKHGLSGAGGDIIADKESGFPFINRFHIECKESQNMGNILLQLLLNNELKIGKWSWQVLRKEAAKFQRIPFLALKPFRKREQLIVLPLEEVNDVLDKFSILHSILHEKKERLVIMKLQEFFQISPSIWR